MKKIEFDELKKIQLDILTVVDKFCRENGINYSLGCGSMLGAIRHKGYIPWDDDIDIYILREEYNKLLSLFPVVLGDVKIASLGRTPKWDLAYAKAYDNNTFMEDAGHSYKIGVGIDIYPIDRVPENEQEWILYNKKRRYLQLMFKWKNSQIFRKGRPLWKYFFLPVTKSLLLPFSSRRIAIFIDRYAQKYKDIESKLVFECCQGMLQNRPFKRTTLENVMDVPFEDRVFKGMVDYDDYLTNGYGDWRKMPPKDKQVPHHVFKAWRKE